MAFSVGPQHVGTFQIRTDRNRDGQFSYLDANRNSRYDQGDSVIVSDVNGDGKFDASDANGTSKIFNLMKDPRNPNIDDVKGFGIFPNNRAERQEARIWASMAHKVDHNGDGVVNGAELGPSCGPEGLKLVNDYNGDGKFTGQDFAGFGTPRLQSVNGGHSATVTWPASPSALGTLAANSLPRAR